MAGPELQDRLLREAADLVPACACGLYVLPPHSGPPAVAALGVSDNFLRQYEQLGRGSDPVWAHVRATGITTTNDMLPAQRWRSSPVFRQVLAPEGITQTLQAPVAVHGRLRGSLNFARGARDPAFRPAEVEGARVAAALIGIALSLDPARRDVSSPMPPLSTGAGGQARLTPREAEVATLVAQGLRNAEIAASLYMSVYTVKKHLQSLFAKLEVGSRVDLARYVITRPGADGARPPTPFGHEESPDG